MSANETKQFQAALALELTCPICLELFTEPVSLTCGHIFCFRCLRTMGEGLDQHSCPECQAEYSGAESLVKSIKLCNIIETYKSGRSLSAAHFGDSLITDDISVREDLKTHCNQSPASSGQASKDHRGGYKLGEDVHSGHESTENVLTEEERSHKSKMAIKEPKSRLASQITELKLKLEMAEGVLGKYKEVEHEIKSTNTQKRERVFRLLDEISHLSKSYTETVAQMIEEELNPGEANVSSRVQQACELTEQLRQATSQAEALMAVEDETAFRAELQSLQPHVNELITKPVNEEELSVEAHVGLARVCPVLEHMNTKLREQLGEIQRSLRETLNPSELTFNPETAHPNLLLSEDLKTVTFSSIKQTYPFSPQRFTSFFQVLSSQSFSEGDHRWEVELDGSPWIIGVCYSEELARHGVASALESSKSSWCLMWCNNLLSAFDQGRNVPLKKTTVSCRLQIELSFRTHTMSVYNISDTSGKTHVYTFTVNLREPLHLAYRMMSGHPKARVTIHS